MKEYRGEIGRKLQHIGPALKHAYYSHGSQMQRCYNKNNPRYKSYGAKGIKVEYTRRQLIQWVKENVKNLNDPNFVIGRIDHEKNYNFKNIRIETKHFSSKERVERLGSPSKYIRKKMLIMKNGKEFMTALDKRWGFRFCGIKSNNTSRYINDGIITKSGYSFKGV